MQSNLKIVFLIVLITLITYINILPNKLFFDDEELIYKNAYVQNIKYFPRFFSENMIAGAGKISNMYRPILMTTFAFDHIFWGNNPFGYHLTSILLHASNGILIYFLIFILFKNRLISFITSLLFIIHPVQSEAVIYASGRTDPLYVFFSLVSIHLFLSLLKTKINITLKWCGSIIFFLWAILSKESAIIIPVLFILLYYAFDNKQKISYFRFLTVTIPFVLLSFIYVLLRLTILNFANTLNFYQTGNIYSRDVTVRLLTFTSAFTEYLKVILFPKDLISARNPQIITSIVNPNVIFFVVFFLSTLIISWALRKKDKIYLFAFIWFFITIIPVSGIIPINNIIAEHYLYLPSVMFFLLTAKIFNNLWYKFVSYHQRLILSLLITLILITLMTRTAIRTFDWRDPITFYTKSLKQSPWHIPMHNNLAMAYAEQGRSDEAIQEYQKTIQLEDVYPNLHHNLANTYKDQGKYQEAEKEYKKALDMDPNFIFSYYGLADLYQKTGEKEKLEEIIKKLK